MAKTQTSLEIIKGDLRERIPHAEHELRAKLADLEVKLEAVEKQLAAVIGAEKEIKW